MTPGDLPHKAVAQHSSHPGGTTNNPSVCDICGKRAGHPIHQKKYRGKPLAYQLMMENLEAERSARKLSKRKLIT
jgi:hypothetical protein